MMAFATAGQPSTSPQPTMPASVLTFTTRAPGLDLPKRLGGRGRYLWPGVELNHRHADFQLPNRTKLLTLLQKMPS
jgi:hypothetical protein